MKAMWKVMVCVLVAAMFLMPMSMGRGHMYKDNNTCYGGLNGDWEKTYDDGTHDFGLCVQQTSDGGYILLGEGAMTGDSYIWLIKTDSEGNKEWDKTYGGNKAELGWQIKQTHDGGYIVIGRTKSFGAGDYDAWLIKTDSTGNKEWDKTYGGPFDDRGYNVISHGDGGYTLLGMTTPDGKDYSDVWLIKTDSNGNKQWEETYGGAAEDWGYSLRTTSDGGYIISGHTLSFGSGKKDAWLIKTDSEGNEEWNKTFGGASNEGSTYAQQTQDGGYMITGYTESYGDGKTDMWLVKTDENGNKEWDHTYGGTSNEQCMAATQTADSGYVLAGWQGRDAWIVKTDADGNKVWTRTSGGHGYAHAYSIQELAEGGYIIFGDKSENLWLMKLANFPPNKPEEPTGPSSGKIGKEYTYTASCIETNNDQVYYKWDWGDGNTSDWLGPFESGETVEASYTWQNQGNYTIRVKAKDDSGLESLWSDPLAVSMPKVRIRPMLSLLEQLATWLMGMLCSAR